MKNCGYGLPRTGEAAVVPAPPNQQSVWGFRVSSLKFVVFRALRRLGCLEVRVPRPRAYLAAIEVEGYW